ncbi:MAG: hypothetical protein K6G16_04305 [Lachnospiraceae bacterium]|nr:hypothetical protein [Lachnospiraceae bacterium]
MIYLVSFGIALLLLLLITAYSRAIDINMILLLVIIAVSSGGFFAMAASQNLAEALLANKIAYVGGVFAPMIVLLIICSICRVSVPVPLRMAMYVAQLLVYASVCTMGKGTLFYRSAAFKANSVGAFLDKEYGPLHTVYLVMLLAYTIAGIGIGLYSLNRKNVVSRINVYTLLFADVFAVGTYLVERIVHLDVELVPMIFTVCAVVYASLLIRLNNYSIFNNQSILEERIRNIGYIYFDRKLRFMGCNECATALFPELEEWELEKRIPGNGGRFNTFLRQPLLSFAGSADPSEPVRKNYEYKGRVYRFEISAIRTNGRRFGGFVIQVKDATDESGRAAGAAEADGGMTS